MKHLMVTVALLSLTASCAPVPAPSPILASQPEDYGTIIAARQAAFQLSATAAGGMKSAADRGQPAKAQAFAARGLARWANVLPRMFPAGSIASNSRAKADIWLNRADFDTKAANFSAAAKALVAAAERDDAAAFTAQLAATQQKCNACHSVFRAEARPR